MLKKSNFISLRYVCFLLFVFLLIVKANSQTLDGVTATGSATTNSSTFSTVTGASVTVDVTNVDYVLLLSSFELQMISPGIENREASLRIVDNANPGTINSGSFKRSLSAAKATDYGIGSIVHIFDVSASSGNKTYELQHAFSTTARTLTTSGTLVAISLSTATIDLNNANQSVSSAVTMGGTWSVVTGTETSVLTTTASGGFYVSASVESLTTTFNTSSTAEWKLQYKKGAAGTWTDLSNSVQRSMSNTSDKGLISLVGYLPDNSSAGDYYFRIAHKRISATSTIQTTAANIVAVSLASASGVFPIYNASGTGLTTTSSTMTNAVTSTFTPDINTDVFIHSQYEITANALTNSPKYDLYVDNSILDGADQRRYVSSSSDIGSGASVSLAENLIADTEYQVSLRHASASSNTLTTNNVLLTGFALTLNSGPLPVELLSFDAFQLFNEIELNWETASENNNDYFVLEKSLDMINWKILDVVDGAGNSNTNLEYSYVDNQLSNDIIYYRLKQVDFDNTMEVIALSQINPKLEDLTISVFPTICKDILFVKTDLSKFYYKIIGVDGINYTSLTTSSPYFQNQVSINVSTLKSGTYFIVVNNTTNKFIIEN